MSSASSAQPASSAAASQNLSNALGSIGQTSTDSPSGTNSASSATASSEKSSNSESQTATATSAAGSNTITDAPNLGSSSSSAAVSSLTGAPSLTSNDGIPTLTGLPTLSGYYSYPPPTVPPSQGAPYLQKNNLPENFVFIIVGACIAFVALIVIGWRFLTAWSINRRFRRGEGAVAPGGKASYTPLADFKQKPAAASTHDMKDLGSLPRNFSSVPSLFFSPTAQVAKQSMRTPSGMDNSYAHLPPGHYRDASRS